MFSKVTFTRDRMETVPNRSGPDRIGSGFVYMEPFGTGPAVYRGHFLNRSGTDPKLDLQKSRPSFGSIWIRFGSVPERSRVNRKPNPVRFLDRIRLEPVPCKHSLIILLYHHHHHHHHHHHRHHHRSHHLATTVYVGHRSLKPSDFIYLCVNKCSVDQFAKQSPLYMQLF